MKNCTIYAFEIEQVETVGGDIQSQQSEHAVQQMHDGRQDNDWT